MTLAHDISRCCGVSPKLQQFEQCANCLRRITPGGERTPHNCPPEFIETCESRIT